MGKGKGLGFAAVAAAVGAAAVAVKYLKDYTDFKTAAEHDFHELEGDKEDVKTAAQRTYISIRDKGDVKTAAGDLAKAAGEVAKDAGSIAKKAGKTTVQTVKEMKARYEADPEGTKNELIGNIRDIGADVSRRVSDAASTLSEKLKTDRSIVYVDETPEARAAETKAQAEAMDAAGESCCCTVSGAGAAEDKAQPEQEAAVKPEENSESAAAGEGCCCCAVSEADAADETPAEKEALAEAQQPKAEAEEKEAEEAREAEDAAFEEKRAAAERITEDAAKALANQNLKEALAEAKAIVEQEKA